MYKTIQENNSYCAIHDVSGLKLLTRLRSNFSHLNEHKFRHHFKDTNNPKQCGVVVLSQKLQITMTS